MQRTPSQTKHFLPSQTKTFPLHSRIGISHYGTMLPVSVPKFGDSHIPRPALSWVCVFVAWSFSRAPYACLISIPLLKPWNLLFSGSFSRAFVNIHLCTRVLASFSVLSMATLFSHEGHKITAPSPTTVIFELPVLWAYISNSVLDCDWNRGPGCQAGATRPPCFDDFVWATSMFCSRSIGLPVSESADSNVVQAIVPGLDFCNHAAAPNCRCAFTMLSTSSNALPWEFAPVNFHSCNGQLSSGQPNSCIVCIQQDLVGAEMAEIPGDFVLIHETIV